MVSNDCVVCYLRDSRICGWQMGRKGMRGGRHEHRIRNNINDCISCSKTDRICFLAMGMGDSTGMDLSNNTDCHCDWRTYVETPHRKGDRVMRDCISRQAAIDALENTKKVAK